MSNTGSTFIKSEPTDYGFDPNQYAQFPQGHSFNNMNMNFSGMNGGMQNFNQGNMSASFNAGNSGIADDELLDLELSQGDQPNSGYDFGQGMNNFLQQQQFGQANNAMYSHTPDGAPIQSPFTHNEFAYAPFRTVQGQQFGSQSMPQQPGFRPQAVQMDRKISNSRSPATPNTPGMNYLQVGDDNHPGMQQIRHQRQQGSIGNGWDSTSSHHSFNESSPFPSPANGHAVHAQISEVMKTNSQNHSKVASSLPTRMEGSGPPGFTAQEAKRRRRRESHNLVERKRRDNINERIQEMGTLVPQHRLEDEKVKKHLQTNAPLSPSIAKAEMSPSSPATSLLAGAQARRATGAGNITQGLPPEDKEKGPNKGEILNSSVAWARDLLWWMEMKMTREQKLKQLLQQTGTAWPFESTDEERRMESEIVQVIARHQNDLAAHRYSRAAGSGLRVPGFTNVAGETLNADGSVTNANGQPSLSPGFQPGGSGVSSGLSYHGQTNFWDNQFKEEDEYEDGMEMQ